MAQPSNEEKNLLNELLPNVAVEMRGPLGLIHASLRKLQQDEIPGTELLSMSYYRLLRLAGNLSAAELLDGKQHYLRERRDGDIADFCRRLAEQVRPLAAGNGVELHCSGVSRPCIIAYDEQLIERLLLNLLSNALKFTPAGGKITLTVQEKGKSVMLSVKDTGCGIAPELLGTLFDRYLHSDRMDPPPHGLGLGLPICRMIAVAHGGSIVAHSRPGQGTKIIVSLPNERSILPCMQDPFFFDYAGGFDHVMVELSDALRPEAYQPKPKEE